MCKILHKITTAENLQDKLCACAVFVHACMHACGCACVQVRMFKCALYKSVCWLKVLVGRACSDFSHQKPKAWQFQGKSQAG